jgi:hypothetical protein
MIDKARRDHLARRIDELSEQVEGGVAVLLVGDNDVAAILTLAAERLKQPEDIAMKLKKYGQHLQSCVYWRRCRRCDCGLG